MNTLGIINHTYGQKGHTGYYAPQSKHELLDKQVEELKFSLLSAKQFELDVYKSQLFYDSQKNKTLREFLFNEFNLPFDNCLFAFKEPLVITWMNQERSAYEDHKLIGINVFKRSYGELDTLGQQEVESADGKVKIRMDRIMQPYKAFLLFEENMSINGVDTVIGNQFILFNFMPYIEHINKKAMLFHVDHYPCQNKVLCNINAMGYPKSDMGNEFVCQEIMSRESLIETLFYIVNKIHEVTPIFKEKEKPTTVTMNEKKPWVASLPWGWPWTKGNLPKDHYTLYLDSYRYKYDPEDSNPGSGIKHRYRYDVRRHPRIVGDKIVWVDPHQRGAGKYIPKTYKNRKAWRIPYVWYITEKLTKYRIVEILIVRGVKLVRKLLKRQQRNKLKEILR